MVDRSKTPITVEMRIDADRERLYGPILEAIAYLREVHAQHPNAELDEHWTGYEDMDMTFVWHRQETDDEFQARQKQIAEEDRRAELQQREAETKSHRRKQWERLKREFGP